VITGKQSQINWWWKSSDTSLLKPSSSFSIFSASISRNSG